MSCSKEEALIRLFYNSSSSFKLLFLFIFSSSTLLIKFLNFIGSYPLFQRDQQYEYVSSEYDYEEEDEQEEEIRESYCYEDSFEKDHLVADIICGGESLVFLHNNINKSQRNLYSSSFEEEEEEFITPQDSLIEEYVEEEKISTESLYVHQESPIVSDFETETNETEFQTEEEDADSVHDSVPDSVPVENRTTSPITHNLYKSDDLVEDIDKNYDGINFTS
ncbi:hypothetical protein TSUD_138400 [Trifolium subterraneum]|uniref:Uncharacterized protein n=1 Tax=Trifolium subterraneum TaxID=3900 RepID=A0A2Z6N0N3_TRISU|nr:hypothetical protein TSUD_138400 [Trifolium subterraneum]